MRETVIIVGPPGMEREAVKKSVELTGEFRAVTVTSLRAAGRSPEPGGIACELHLYVPVSPARASVPTGGPAPPPLRVLIETTEVPDAWLIGGLRTGAVAVIAWPCLASELRGALQAARLGEVQLTPRAGGLLAGAIRNAPPRQLWELKLTVRERQVARELRAGATNKDIARRLGISTSTVERHLTAIYRKLGVQSRTEAVLHLRRRPRAEPPAGTLTGLERRIVAGVLQGLGNDAIAERLGLSRHTIEAHLTRAYLSHRVRNRLELLAKLTTAA